VALESCGSGCGCRGCGGFAALPAPLVAVARGAASGGAKGAVKSAAAYGAQQAWKQTGLPGQMPTSVGGAAKTLQTLGRQEADKIYRDTLSDMKVPYIAPGAALDLLKNPTPEKVKDAAYGAAKPYLESAIQSKTGVPLKLPDKLSVEALGKMVGSVFPTNVAEALNLALGVGVQVAASALTSVLAGTAIGSVIPGLGTIVGLAVGLAVAGIRSMFTTVPAHSEGRECWTGKTPPKFSSNPFQMAKNIEAAKKSKISCPNPPTNLNALQLFDWSTRTMQPMWDGLRREQATHMCGRGEAINCVRGLNQMRDIAFWMALPTVGDLGLAAVTNWTNTYSKLPEISGGINFVVGYRGTQPLSDAIVHRNQALTSPGELTELLRRRAQGSAAITRSTPFLPGESRNDWGGRRPLELSDYVSSKLLLQALRWRKEQLERLLQSAQAGTASRMDLMTELSKAAVQIQYDPSSNAISWFKTLWPYVDRMEKAEEARLKAMRADQTRRTAYGQAQIQKDPREAELKTLRAGCQTGHQPSCARLKQLQGSPPPAPARPFVPAIPKPAPKFDVAQAFCKKLLADWTAGHPAEAKCLGPAEKMKVLSLCYQAHGTKTLSLEQSVWEISKVLDKACSRAKRLVVPSRPTARYV
jgi:hypothetical protein